MNPAMLAMLERYSCRSTAGYENALKEILQELALLGLWRSKFFEHAAFYGGTALRILYGLDRFSEDLDFSLLHPDAAFTLRPHLRAIEEELRGMGFNVTVEQKEKIRDSAIESAFIKAGTREHLLKISAPEALLRRVHKATLLKIKLELDVDPPGGFETEARTILQPIPFAVRAYQRPDLFAGKIHAVLQRGWRGGRVKGRDYYDFVWYVARDVPVRVSHLEQRLRQSGAWETDVPLAVDDIHRLLDDRFAKLDVAAARNDVLPFLKDPASIAVWSNAFFLSLLEKLKVTP